MKIDIMSLIKLKANLSKSFHIQPSEVDAMPMWEFELYVKTLNEIVEAENEEHQKEQSKYKDYSNMKPQNLRKVVQDYGMKPPSINYNGFREFK